MIHAHEVLAAMDKILILRISDVELMKFLRRELKIGIQEAFVVAKMLKKAHSMGETRGKALKQD